MSFEPIENYGAIGNMRSIALVGMNGSIDFLCFPKFDSPTVFAALLDDQRGGRFQIQPQLENVRVRQLYLPDTNILLTRFMSNEGLVELTDFMPIRAPGGAFPQDCPFLEELDREVQIQRSVARDGEPLRIDPEAAHQPRTWLPDRGSNVFLT